MEAATFDSAEARQVGIIEIHSDPETILRAVLELVDGHNFIVHRATNQCATFILIDRRQAGSGRDADD
jgi:hypothetical protein